VDQRLIEKVRLDRLHLEHPSDPRWSQRGSLVRRRIAESAGRHQALQLAAGDGRGALEPRDLGGRRRHPQDLPRLRLVEVAGRECRVDHRQISESPANGQQIERLPARELMLVPRVLHDVRVSEHLERPLLLDVPDEAGEAVVEGTLCSTRGGEFPMKGVGTSYDRIQHESSR
jgi:hypothetical protein